MEGQVNMHAHGLGVFASPANLSAPALHKQTSTALGPKAKARESTLGLPRVPGSLPLLGLCVYSFAVITFFLPVAQVGIAIGVAGLFAGRNPVRMPTLFRLYLAFILWGLITSIASPFAEVALDTLVGRCKLLIIMLLALNAFQTEGQLQFYLLFVLGCFILFPARGTFIGGDVIQGRAVWNHVYNNPNDLAALSLLALGVALALIFSASEWNLVRLGAAASAAILLVVILRTQSRGVFLGVVVATAPTFIRILLQQMRVAVGIGIVVVLVASFAIPPKVWDRLSGIQKLTSADTIAQSDKEGSAAERVEILKAGWQIFLDNPVLGVGLGVFPLECNLYSPIIGKRDTHNTYLNLAAETGLPGLAIWCALVGSALLRAHRARRRASDGVLKAQNYWTGQALIGYLVAGAFGTYSGLNLLYLILSVLWCSTDLLAADPPRPISHAGARRA